MVKQPMNQSTPQKLPIYQIIIGIAIIAILLNLPFAARESSWTRALIITLIAIGIIAVCAVIKPYLRKRIWVSMLLFYLFTQILALASTHRAELVPYTYLSWNRRTIFLVLYVAAVVLLNKFAKTRGLAALLIIAWATAITAHISPLSAWHDLVFSYLLLLGITLATVYSKRLKT